MSGSPPPERLYLPTDMVGDWQRSHIDRDASVTSQSFAMAFGRLCTPVQVACDIAAERGEVGIFDGGCGTGNGLKTWRDRVLLHAPDARVRAVGLNDIDLSRESGSARTRRAFAEDSGLTYVVGRLETAASIGQLFDVSQAFEVLIHSRRPEELLEGLVDVTAPGGHIFFNLGSGESHYRGNAQRKLFRRAVDQLRRTGHTADSKQATGRNSAGEFLTRTFFHIVRPA